MRFGAMLASLLPVWLTFSGPALADKNPGPEWSYSYTTNPAANLLGGIKPDVTYTDNHLLSLRVPYSGLFGGAKGSINFSLLDRNGQNLSADAVGNQFTVQEIYGGQTVIYYALNVVAEFDRLNTVVRLGRMSTGELFATDSIYWLYVNNAICGNPQSLIVNTNSGFSAYPAAKWGGAMTSRFGRDVALHFGVFQIADVDVTKTHGLDWTIDGKDGVFLIAQLDLNRKEKRGHPSPVLQSSRSGRSAASLPSEVILSPFGESSSLEPIETNAFTGMFLSLKSQQGWGGMSGAESVYGFYAHVDRQVFREPDAALQGLYAWAAASLTPQGSVAKMPAQLNGGLIYTGLFPGRDDDLSMLGLFGGRFSADYLATTDAATRTPLSTMPGYELVIELDHRFVLSPSTYIQPNLQIVVNPGGTGTIPGSLVVGVQAGVSF